MATSNKKTFHEFLENAPGLCGQIARYIYDHLEWREPGIALGSAITFCATLKSKRIINQFNIAPNIYGALIVETGRGKTQAQHIIQSICEATKASSLIIGKPKSSSGLLDAFHSENRQFLIWDEFGIAISALSKSKSSHEAMILSEMMDLFSSANRIYIGGAYSKKTTPTRTDISQPHLSILGASTPNRFYESLNHNFIHDGFLTRWLIFEGQKEVRGKTPKRYPIPNHILEKVITINERRPDSTLGDIGELIHSKPSLLAFEGAANDLINNYGDLIKGLTERSTSSIQRAFYSRLFEHTVKLCAVFEENSICDERTFCYCQSLALFLVDNAIDTCAAKIFENQFLKEESDLYDKMLSLLKVGESIERSELTRKTQRWGSIRNRDAVISHLINSDIWIKSKHQNRTTYTRTR